MVHHPVIDNTCNGLVTYVCSSLKPPDQFDLPKSPQILDIQIFTIVALYSTLPKPFGIIR